MSNVQANPRAEESIFQGYAPAAASYDEVFHSDGEVRDGWRELLATADQIGRTELTRRWSRAQEEIQAEGIAYNPYDDSTGVARPWELDLLPLLIGTEEWSALATGLEQRARLLNRVLADFYGPQELLTRGLVPADWLFSHPGFRRVFHGQQSHGGTFLHIYSADLARAADGRWWVARDRTDAPLGLGYALENRILASRMLPNAIRRFYIERLAPFFIRLQETLRDLTAARRDNPRIVLLSQGPSGANYFEDAYLARYLGYTLVEGGDLAVRDDHVFLKTLAGLLPVDVVLRRISDEDCDPLESGSAAEYGVPGLLQAARLGHVAVANALGSSLVESPSLMPFLPGIAREWLGEELALPSVATWWCGQAKARSKALKLIESGELTGYSVRSAYRLGRREAVSAAGPHGKSPRDVRSLLESRPDEFIVQEMVQRSTSPVWYEDEPNRLHVALRVYVVAGPDSYHVMPGGLARLAREPGELDLSVFGGQVSKDTWIRSTGPVRHVSLLATAKQPVVLRRSGADLPSRVADNLFWFGRHLERAQGTARLLRSVVARLTGEGEMGAAPDLDYLVRCLALQGQIEPGFAVEEMKDKLPEITNVLPAAVLDEQQPGSLRSSIAHAHRNASQVRDRLSLDGWRIVHHLERTSSLASERAAKSDPSPADVAKANEKEIPTRKFAHVPFGLVELDGLIDELIVSLAALDGLIGESMTRTSAWRFLDLGRRLERASHTVSLVQSLPDENPPEQGRGLEAVLEVVDSLMTYRSRYLAAIHRAAALDLLLTDETNPRSLAYQLATIADHVGNMPRGDAHPLGTPEDRIAGSLLHGVRMVDVEDLSVAQLERSKLEKFLLRTLDQLPKLSNLVSHRYFIHAGRPRQMSEGRREHV